MLLLDKAGLRAPAVRRIAGPRNSTMPVLAAPYRSFSAGPASSPGEPPAAVQKPPPLIDWGQAPSALPDPTILEPLSAAFLSLPPTLSLSYAAFIPLFTILYRTCTTLPVTFWQQARIRRFRDLATPVLKRELGKVALETRAECRRAGKSFEEYQAEYKKRVRFGVIFDLLSVGVLTCPAGETDDPRGRAEVQLLAAVDPVPASARPHPPPRHLFPRPPRRLRPRRIRPRRRAVPTLVPVVRVPDFGLDRVRTRPLARAGEHVVGVVSLFDLARSVDAPPPRSGAVGALERRGQSAYEEGDVRGGGR